MRNVSEKIIVGSRESLLAKQHIKIFEETFTKYYGKSSKNKKSRGNSLKRRVISFLIKKFPN